MTISNKASSGLSEIQHNGTTFLEADGTDVTIKGNLVVEGSSGMIGVGQTWTDILASRAHGTDYTNNTGKPIAVSIRAGCTTSTGIELLVDSVIVGYYQGGNVSSIPGMVCAIVPDGSVYRLNRTGAPTISVWSELR